MVLGKDSAYKQPIGHPDGHIVLYLFLIIPFDHHITYPSTFRNGGDISIRTIAHIFISSTWPKCLLWFVKSASFPSTDTDIANPAEYNMCIKPILTSLITGEIYIDSIINFIWATS